MPQARTTRPVAILGVPTRYGTAYPGSETTPAMLRRSGSLQRLQQWGTTLTPPLRVDDAGDVPIPNVPWFPDTSPLRSLDAVLAVTEAQALRVEQLLAAGNVPLVIGGDCTTMLGTAAGLQRAGYHFGLVCFDAHGDFNTDATTPSGNIHGMTVAALAGHGDARLLNLFHGPVTVPPAHMALLGVRDLDPPEAVALSAAHVTVIPPAELLVRGARACGQLAHAIATAATLDGLLLHLDLDVLDPAVAPGVGLPVAGGLTLEALLAALDPLLSSGRIIAAELTEAAPGLDATGKTEQVLALLLQRLVTGIAGRFR